MKKIVLETIEVTEGDGVGRFIQSPNVTYLDDNVCLPLRVKPGMYRVILVPLSKKKNPKGRGGR